MKGEDVQKAQRHIFKFVNSSTFNQFTDALVGIGIDSSRDRFFTQALLLSSLFISIASGWTTWLGFREYVTDFIAFLATCAIQGLLFASCWRLRYSVVSGFRFLLPVVLIVTMTISIFFSYSALLDGIYHPEMREKYQLARAKKKASSIIDELSTHLGQENSSNLLEFKAQLGAWETDFRKDTLEAADQIKQEEVDAAFDTYLKDKLNFDREVRAGGTKAGNKVTDPGYGRYAKMYEEVMERSKKTYETKLTKLNAIRQRTNEMGRATTDIMGQRGTLTIASVDNLLKKHGELVSLLAGYGFKPNIPIPSALIRQLEDFKDGGAYQQGRLTTNTIRKMNSLDEIKQLVSQALDESTAAPVQLRIDATEWLDTLGLLDGTGTHHFILSVNELYEQQNFLAFGALMIALAIDLLVIGCAFVGKRPNSYLDITDPRDLSEMKENALEAMFSFDPKRKVFTEASDPHIRMFSKLLNLGNWNAPLAYEGYSLVIAAADIEKHDFGKDVGALIAFGLADIVNERHDIGIKTNTLLWFSDAAANYELYKKSSENFRNTFDDDPEQWS